MIGRISSGKKSRGIGLISEKTEVLHAELNERAEAATSSYSVTGDFLWHSFCSCAYPVSEDPMKVFSS